jgi:hypothetical protein
MAPGKGQAVNEALAYFMAGQKRRKRRPVADMRENDSLREKPAQGFKHPFAATAGCKPMVDESYAQFGQQLTGHHLSSARCGMAPAHKAGRLSFMDGRNENVNILCNLPEL